MDRPVELLQGTLDILILKAVSLCPLHGYGVLQRIHQISGNRLQIPQGSFYVALYRIEHKGWLKGSGENPTTIAALNSIGSPRRVLASLDRRRTGGRI